MEICWHWILSPSFTSWKGIPPILTSFPNLEIAPLTPAIASLAARLRAQFGARTPDAIHLATAICHKAAGFITNDKGFQRMESELNIWMMDGA